MRDLFHKISVTLFYDNKGLICYLLYLRRHQGSIKEVYGGSNDDKLIDHPTVHEWYQVQGEKDPCVLLEGQGTDLSHPNLLFKDQDDLWGTQFLWTQ